MSKQKQLKKKVSVKETEKIEIPKYVLEGNQNIPEDLKKVLDYFRDCGNKNYQVILVGEKESVAKDLKERGYQGEYPFIHFDPKELDGVYGFLPVSVKNSIRRINRLISNPENSFNITPLGIHTLGLLNIDEKKPLNDLGYGKTSWNVLGVVITNVLFSINTVQPGSKIIFLTDNSRPDEDSDGNKIVIKT